MSRFLEDLENDDEVVEGSSQRLVEGIDLKKLVSNGSLFEVDGTHKIEEKDEVKAFYDDSEIPVEFGQWPVLLESSSYEEIGKQMTNVDPQGLIKKKLLKAGHGEVVPARAKVYVHYNMYVETQQEPIDSTFFRSKPCCFTLGDGKTCEVIIGLDAAVKTMKKGEQAAFLVHWSLAFGAQGVEPRIPREAEIVLDVTLNDFIDAALPEPSDALTEEEQTSNFMVAMKQAKVHHQAGNKEFASKNYWGAVKSYGAGLRILFKLNTADEEEDSEKINLEVKMYCNLANCFSHLGKPERVCRSCQEVLDRKQDHTKAMFFYGRALIRLNSFDQAQGWLKRAQRNEPRNLEISEEMKLLESKVKESKLGDKAFCQKMFGSSEKETEEPPKPSDHASEKETKEPPKPSDLTAFENNLKTCLSEHFAGATEPFEYPANLVAEELELCKKVGEVLQLKVTVVDDVCTFSK